MGRMDTKAVCTLVRKRVGATIKQLCLDRGISQAKLAAMISMNRSHLNQIVGGKSNTTLDILVKIADGLDVPVTELFIGLDEVPPHELATSYDGYGLETTDASEAGGGR